MHNYPDKMSGPTMQIINSCAKDFINLMFPEPTIAISCSISERLSDMPIEKFLTLRTTQKPFPPGPLGND